MCDSLTFSFSVEMSVYYKDILILLFTNEVDQNYKYVFIGENIGRIHNKNFGLIKSQI